MDHRPPLIATPSNETTIAHWLYLLAQDAGHIYEATGQYGFLDGHAANLPPFSQWGYDIVPSPWDSDTETFASVGFNNILLTAGNFMQWQPANVPYFGGNGVTSPLSATIDIADWVNAQAPSAKIFIYENWPDMAGYISSGTFPPTAADFVNYNNYLNGDFHDWWIDYHDWVMQARPDLEVRMIPVGPILADLFTNTALDQIPLTELYEDNAPHGRATTYFLAALVTYMAIFEEAAPANYAVPSIVHSVVQNNYSTVVNHIWTSLLNFDDANGDNRVFFPQSTALPVELADFKGFPQGNANILEWKTAAEIDHAFFEIERASEPNTDFKTIGKMAGKAENNKGASYRFTDKNIETTTNYYRLKQVNLDGSFTYSPTILIENKERIVIQISPNLVGNEANLSIQTIQNGEAQISVFNLQGQLMDNFKTLIGKGLNQVEMNFSELNAGVYFLKYEQGGVVEMVRFLKE